MPSHSTPTATGTAAVLKNHNVRGHALRRRRAREPQVVERSKTTAFVFGQRASKRVQDAMRELVRVKRPLAVQFTRRNEMLPMEDPAPLESVLNHRDCGLFFFANHSKKRPDNVVLGRTFDGHVLDMVETGITHFETVAEVLARSKAGAAVVGAAPPMLVFRGEGFANAPEGSELATLKSLLLDAFRGALVSELDLEALDLALVFTSSTRASDGKTVVAMRGYRASFKPAGDGSPAPKVELLEHGPHMDLELRRAHVAAPNLAKLARKQAKLRPVTKKRKNVSHDPVRGKIGRVHLGKHKLDGLVQRSRFRKALKRGKAEQETEARARKRVKG